MDVQTKERELVDFYVGMKVENGVDELIEFPVQTNVFGGSHPHKDVMPNRLDSPVQMKCMVFGQIVQIIRTFEKTWWVWWWNPWWVRYFI
jgi:hypothetical protein